MAEEMNKIVWLYDSLGEKWQVDGWTEDVWLCSRKQGKMDADSIG